MKTLIFLALSTGLALLGFFLFTPGNEPGIDLKQRLSIASTDNGKQDSAIADQTKQQLSGLKQQLAALMTEVSELKKANARRDYVFNELTALKEEVALLHEQVNAEKNTHAMNNSEEFAIGEEGPTVVEGQHDSTKEARREQINNMLLDESTDEEWSVKTVDQLTQVFEKAPIENTNLSAVECRSTICKIEVEHIDAKAADQFVFDFSIHLSEILPLTTYFNESLGDGRIATTFYLGREPDGISQASL